ncbi:hypothetical protein J437_LFUL011732 [Ladona fulva]|uniref:Uncharacterized protein n=1 Tax=Ladona fulva TaxID=123851 RepID=A0A8K0KCA9_LADFU|nr:hypothetical protein J437_LFUL011732 [Ladona fulva]
MEPTQRYEHSIIPRDVEPLIIEDPHEDGHHQDVHEDGHHQDMHHQDPHAHESQHPDPHAQDSHHQHSHTQDSQHQGSQVQGSQHQNQGHHQNKDDVQVSQQPHSYHHDHGQDHPHHQQSTHHHHYQHHQPYSNKQKHENCHAACNIICEGVGSWNPDREACQCAIPGHKISECAMKIARIQQETGWPKELIVAGGTHGNEDHDYGYEHHRAYRSIERPVTFLFPVHV